MSAMFGVPLWQLLEPQHADHADVLLDAYEEMWAAELDRRQLRSLHQRYGARFGGGG